jgi:tripartite motif-containing protein 71
LLISKSIKIPSKASTSIVTATLLLFTTLLIASNIIGVPSVEAKYVFSKSWGFKGTGNGQFDQPDDVTIDSAGILYVLDANNNRVQKFQLASPCPAGTAQIVAGVCFVTKWGAFGSGNGEFKFPIEITTDSLRRVFIGDGDSGNHRIEFFKSSGIFIKTWGAYGTAPGQFGEPTGVAVDSLGAVYVVDFTFSRVIMFQLANPCPVRTTQIISGVCYLTEWGSQGSGNGEFIHPHGAALDSSGHVYVADLGNNRIQKFTTYGGFIKAWGVQGSGNGQFNGPIDVATDSAGYVYVADSGNNRIQKFQLANPCPAGTQQVVPGVCFVTTWGSQGSGNGQFNHPSGVAVASSGRVYVADQSNHRIQEFRWVADVGGGTTGGGNQPGAVK